VLWHFVRVFIFGTCVRGVPFDRQRTVDGENLESVREKLSSFVVPAEELRFSYRVSKLFCNFNATPRSQHFARTACSSTVKRKHRSSLRDVTVMTSSNPSACSFGQERESTLTKCSRR
jgi:hypothetical protein